LQNRPESNEAEIYGHKIPFLASNEAEYQTLRREWLRQVEKNKTNARVRLNAVEFIRDKEPEIAQKILEEGRQIEPENFEFPLFLSDFVVRENSRSGQESFEYLKKKSKVLGQAFENGERALALLKKERSSERDARRVRLLESLAQSLSRWKIRACPAVGDRTDSRFGQDANDVNYTEAAHIGNIILGRVAVRQADAAKAKEHLLIAVRAPLRREKSLFSKIDMRLAKELLEMGEKDTSPNT
jgi:hypothetical protein